MIRRPPMLCGCLMAVRFLTRVPLPDPGDACPEVLGRSALCYPLVGLLVGAVLALLWLAAGTLFTAAPALAVAAMVLAVWVWITGALHLDGLADCADAWVGGLGSRERTVAIMKDPHTGSMGVVALVLILTLKFAALASLPTGALGALLLLLTPALARVQLLALALTTRPAGPNGMGAALHRALPRRGAFAAVGAAMIAVTAVCVIAGVWLAGLVLLTVAAGVLLVWRHSMLRRLGGFTGDTAGALVELTEAAVLLTAVLVVEV
jgi:adenosylcobinamide-GDP ribazoletransferase